MDWKKGVAKKNSRIELVSEADLQDDLSDDSDEEILEVEINAEDISEFVQELKQIDGLDTEIICDEDIEIFETPHFEPILDNDFENTDIFFEDNIDDAETEFDTEFFAPTVPPQDFGSNPVLKLHKLDQFLLEKLLKAKKKCLITRYVSQLSLGQEKSEWSNQIGEPIELGDGSFMCHKCMNVYQSRKAINRHIREFHDRSVTFQKIHCNFH